METKNILILYAEVMPYNVITYEALLNINENYFLHVVCWGQDKKLTKYSQPLNDRIIYYDKSKIDFEEILTLYKQTNPALLIICGRMEDDYLKIALRARKDSVKVVMTSDNQYIESVRQKIAICFSYFFYKRYCDYILLPGMYQYEYARRLGFKKENILFPHYCADTQLFEKSFLEQNTDCKKGILFIGRLDKVKGIDLLMKVHKALYDTNLISDKLIIIGDGLLKESLVLDDEHVVYHSFMKQDEIIKIISNIKYFCLPSRFEPWGVVVHEAAAAGLPIVATDLCGASPVFVKQGYNGYLFKSDSETELTNILLKMNNKSDEEIKIMGKRSFELSKQIQPEMWAECMSNLIS